jgi:DNA polymerase
MSSTPSAIDYVHRALSDLQGRGVKVAAAIESLAALAKTGGVPEAPAKAAERPAVPAAAAVPRVEAPVPERKPAPAAAIPKMPATRTAAISGVPSIPMVPKIPSIPTVGAKPTAPAPAAASRAPAAAADAGSKAERLAALHDRLRDCEKCAHLARSRTQVVFGVGNPEAELMFVGEAPGADEDLAGEPFVGKAGQLLTKIIQAMGYSREQVYIANVLKCRPDMPPGESGNRKPVPKEMETCLPYLREQIDIVQPRVLVALGNTAMEGLIGATEPMGRLRGRWHDFHGTPLMATYHPAYLLRNQSLTEKRKVWEDMLLVLERLGAPISEKQRGFFLPKE